MGESRGSNPSFSLELERKEENQLKYLLSRIRQNELEIPYEVNMAKKALLEKQVKAWKAEIHEMKRYAESM